MVFNSASILVIVYLNFLSTHTCLLALNNLLSQSIYPLFSFLIIPRLSFDYDKLLFSVEMLSKIILFYFLIAASAVATNELRQRKQNSEFVTSSSSKLLLSTLPSRNLGFIHTDQILSGTGSSMSRKAQSTDDTWTTADTEDVVGFLLLIGGIILIIIGAILQCCGLPFAGMSSIVVGIILWIIAIGVIPTVATLYIIFPILILLCVAPCWYATYQGKTPIEFFTGIPPPTRSTPQPQGDETTPLLPPQVAAGEPPKPETVDTTTTKSAEAEDRA